MIKSKNKEVNDYILLVDYAFYSSVGYTKIPEAEFPRYSIKAQQVANYHCFNRISPDTITTTNKLGICELAEFYFDKSKTNNGKVLSGFNNGGYSENYSDVNEKLVEDESDIIAHYFTNEQKYRGV